MQAFNKTQSLDAAGTKRVVNRDGTSYIECANTDSRTSSGSGSGFLGIVALMLIAAVVKTGMKGYEIVSALPAYQLWGMIAVATVLGAFMWWRLAGRSAFDNCTCLRGVFSGLVCSAFSLISFLFFAGIFTGVVLAVIGFIANDYSLVSVFS